VSGPGSRNDIGHDHAIYGNLYSPRTVGLDTISIGLDENHEIRGSHEF